MWTSSDQFLLSVPVVGYPLGSIFVGTKLDRVEDISIADDYAREFLGPLNLFDHLKVSSKSGENVMKESRLVVEQILKRANIVQP